MSSRVAERVTHEEQPHWVRLPDHRRTRDQQRKCVRGAWRASLEAQSRQVGDRQLKHGSERQHGDKRKPASDSRQAEMRQVRGRLNAGPSIYYLYRSTIICIAPRLFASLHDPALGVLCNSVRSLFVVHVDRLGHGCPARHVAQPHDPVGAEPACLIDKRVVEAAGELDVLA